MKKRVYLYSFIIFIIDLLSKVLIMKFIKDDVSLIPNFLSFDKITNSGAAFSILNGYRIFFIALGIFVVLYICMHLLNKINTKFEALTYSLLLGGIVGNLFDRIFYGEVVDFISFKIIGYNFPVFNLADAFIVLGACMLVFVIIKGDQNEVRSKRK